MRRLLLLVMLAMGGSVGCETKSTSPVTGPSPALDPGKKIPGGRNVESRSPTMDDAGLIWNRATSHNLERTAPSGDRALSSLLHAHGLIMNGGVLHAVEVLPANELLEAQQGYRYFGLPAVAELLARGRTLFTTERDVGKYERELDSEYKRHIPSDSALTARFEEHLRLHPTDFAPANP